jgi:CBS domain-containing protein
MIATTKALMDYTAADLMSRDLLLIPQRLSLRAAAHLLAQAHVTGAPVIDDAGRCVGVLSSTDLVDFLDRGTRSAKRTAWQQAECVCSEWQLAELERIPEDEASLYMTTDVVKASPAARLGDIARLMIDAHIHRVVVVDGDDRPTGVVSATDVLAAVARSQTSRETRR